MTGQELLVQLKKDGFIIETAEDNYIYSNKLLREPKEDRVPEVEAKTKEYTLQQFCADCRIPFRAKTALGVQYQLNALSDYGKKAFQKVIMEGKYEYEDMVSATSKYYNNCSMARVTLTNYFKQNVFENVMEEYLKSKKTTHNANPPTIKRTGRLSL